jgi:hypothetical protein
MVDLFIAESMHCRNNSSQSHFITGLMNRKVDSLQDQFVTGSIHRRVLSTKNLIETVIFLSGHTKLGSFCCKKKVRSRWAPLES